MPKFFRRLGALSLALTLVFCMLSASALSIKQEQKLNDTGEYLKNNITPQVGSIGGEWVVIGLTRNGIFSEAQKQAYCEAVKAYVASKGTNRLHSRKSSDNSRVILALSAVGKDPRSIAGYDLTEPLADFDYVKKQGINGVIWALIALDSCNYYLQNDCRDQMLGELLSAQHIDGSWGLDENADPDVTGMALQALAPYRKYDSNIQNAVEKALLWLDSLSFDLLSPESCAQLIVAYATLGITPNAGLTDSMMRYSVPNGFAHTLNGEYNQMATEQAYYALAACRRFKNGENGLYDMSDVADHTVLDLDGDTQESINDATYIQRYLAEFEVSFTTPIKRTADLNKNGKVDIGDVTLYQQYLAR